MGFIKRTQAENPDDMVVQDDAIELIEELEEGPVTAQSLADQNRQEKAAIAAEHQSVLAAKVSSNPAYAGHLATARADVIRRVQHEPGTLADFDNFQDPVYQEAFKDAAAEHFYAKALERGTIKSSELIDQAATEVQELFLRAENISTVSAHVQGDLNRRSKESLAIKHGAAMVAKAATDPDYASHLEAAQQDVIRRVQHQPATIADFDKLQDPKYQEAFKDAATAHFYAQSLERGTIKADSVEAHVAEAVSELYQRAEDVVLNSAKVQAAIKERGQAADVEAGDDPDFIDGVPSSVYMLREILRNHDWSDDPADPAGKMIEWTMIESMIRSAIDAGHEKYVKQVWSETAPADHPGLQQILDSRPQFEPGLQQPSSPEPEGSEQYVKPFAAGEIPDVFIRTFDPFQALEGDFKHIPDSPFSKPYEGQDWAQRPDSEAEAAQANRQASPQEAAQGTGSTDLLSKALSAPFAFAAAAGSMVLGAIKAAGDQKRSFFEKKAVNGHLVMSRQLDMHAKQVEGLAESLRADGMGDFIKEIRGSGRSASEVFDGMKPGGAFAKYGEKFDSMMANPAFAAKYMKMQDSVEEFGHLASRYAKAGVDLNLDYAEAIDRNLSKISAATEGFPGKKDGVFKHLQEMAQQIGERIKRLVDGLIGRLAPR